MGRSAAAYQVRMTFTSASLPFPAQAQAGLQSQAAVNRLSSSLPRCRVHKHEATFDLQLCPDHQKNGYSHWVGLIVHKGI